MKTFVQYRTKKIATQFVAGVLIKSGSGEVSKQDWNKIEKDAYGKSLLEAGFLIKVKETKK